MAFFERKWVMALSVLIVIVGFNGISGWLDSRGEKLLDVPGAVQPSVEASETENPVLIEAAPVMVTVHICGAVVSPGVFTLPEGSRIRDALEQAGGFSEKADTISVNLAEVITDGQQIVIYEQYEGTEISGTPGPAKAKAPGAAASGLPVSINQGSLEALMLLNGIGEKTAQKIMDYRKAQGGFKTIEELKNVPGIGDKKFEQIKNDVRL